MSQSRDWNRETVAKHLFEVMNKDNNRGSWDFYVDMGWADGYYRIADEIVLKGYRP
jgi:hypothetical protein